MTITIKKYYRHGDRYQSHIGHTELPKWQSSSSKVVPKWQSSRPTNSLRVKAPSSRSAFEQYFEKLEKMKKKNFGQNEPPCGYVVFRSVN